MTYPIRTDHLVKRFRSVEAIRGIDLAVPAHSICALVGPNGAGKTTLIKTLMNIVQPTSGRAEVLGVDSRALTGQAFQSIGYASENQDLPDWLSVREFLAFTRPLYSNWDRQLEADLIQQFDLPLRSKLRTLSRGMRMKAALATSLAYRPSLIVLDEPFSGLDPVVREELAQSLAKAAGGATIFISSHDLAEVEGLATHLAYLNKGTLLFCEEMKSLTERFREITVIPQTDDRSRVSWPPDWIPLDPAGKTVKFVDSRFDETQTPQQITALFGQLENCSIQPMSLKSIFLAIARSQDSRGSRV